MKNFLKKFFILALPFLVAGSLVAAETNVADSGSPPAAPQPPASTNRAEGSRHIDGALTADQIVEISKAALNRPTSKSGTDNLVAIIAILAVFGSPVAFISVIVLFKANRDKRLHETLRAMVEKGVPIPPELLKGKGSASSEAPKPSDLGRGVRQIAIGLGLMLTLHFLPAFSKFWPIGFIPFFVGIAQLACWGFEKKKSEQEK